MPSEPIPTADGVHLFWVDQAAKERSYSFDQVQLLIRQQLEEERRQLTLAALADSLPFPENSFVPAEEEFHQLLESKDPIALVLRMGEFELRAGRFHNLFTKSLQNEGQPSAKTTAFGFLDALARRERIYIQAIHNGMDQEPTVAERVRQLDRRNILDVQRRRALERKLTNEPEILRAYYDNNSPRFSSPLRVAVRRLRVPITPEDRIRIMARLESVSRTPDTAKTDAIDLEMLAIDLNGTVEDLGWLTLADINQIDSRLAVLIADLEPGQLAAPYHTQDQIALVEVTDRREPEPQPLALVMSQVRQAYLVDSGQRLYRQWADETLASAGLIVFRDRLESAPQ